MGINKIKTKKLLWTHIHKPSKEDIEYLAKEYDFHPLDLEDCLVKIQRPQISEYPHYIFFILTFPVYNRKTREIESSEVDFFLSSKYLITISDGKMSTLENFFDEIKNNEYSQEKYMLANHPIFLLYEIMHRLQNYTFPMLDHIGQDIEDIDRRIFRGQERRLVREILHVKRNIVDFRRIMQAHKNIIKKLMNANTKFFMHSKIDIYFANILDRTKDIWDILETQKENINAFQETNESLISYRLNDIMKTLTIISVIMIPANLVASVFGMNAKDMPFIGLPFDFYIILSFIFVIMLLFIIYFRKKRWL
ncbi:magnesium and cobalt transport protein CorA [Candidatus Parcubacteria bacterium]|nr:MAG: magnesium and cobalt transport protein CorA [Candidatus Parcubacteria bacterium]